MIETTMGHVDFLPEQAAAMIGLAALAQAMGVELSTADVCAMVLGPLLNGKAMHDVDAARAAIRVFVADKKGGE